MTGRSREGAYDEDCDSDVGWDWEWEIFRGTIRSMLNHISHDNLCHILSQWPSSMASIHIRSPYRERRSLASSFAFLLSIFNKEAKVKFIRHLFPASHCTRCGECNTPSNEKEKNSNRQSKWSTQYFGRFSSEEAPWIVPSGPLRTDYDLWVLELLLFSRHLHQRLRWR